MTSLQTFLILVVPLNLLASTAAATAAPPPPRIPWPTPDPRLRPIYHSPSDPATTGYVHAERGAVCLVCVACVVRCNVLYVVV